MSDLFTITTENQTTGDPETQAKPSEIQIGINDSAINALQAEHCLDVLSDSWVNMLAVRKKGVREAEALESTPRSIDIELDYICDNTGVAPLLLESLEEQLTDFNNTTLTTGRMCSYLAGFREKFPQTNGVIRYKVFCPQSNQYSEEFFAIDAQRRVIACLKEEGDSDTKDSTFSLIEPSGIKREVKAEYLYISPETGGDVWQYEGKDAEGDQLFITMGDQLSKPRGLIRDLIDEFDRVCQKETDIDFSIIVTERLRECNQSVAN